VISSLPINRVAPLVAPAMDITRAVPLPSVADRAGPTAIYPPNRMVAQLFDSMGTTIQVETEPEFEAFCAVTATIASYLAFSETIASWLTRQGVPDAEARAYVRAMIRGVVNGDASAEAHATPGGINEQLLRHLVGHRVFEHLSDGLDAVLRSMLQR
jgi:pyrroline-5-carboxylate reductase